MGKQAGSLSLPKLLPNIFTTIGLCSGLTGIRFALEGQWENAVFLILIAACFDMIDGLSARLLKAFSPFGAELDSLADTISFGVAPAIITYLWIRSPIVASQQVYLLEWYWMPVLFSRHAMPSGWPALTSCILTKTKPDPRKVTLSGCPPQRQPVWY